jgi:hypothetical protein
LRKAVVRAERVEQDDEAGDGGHERELAQREPGGHEQRRERGGDHQCGAEVRLRGDEQDRDARDEHQRPDLRRRAQPPGPLGQDAHRVEDERELRDLRRLELERPRAEPAARAVDGHAQPRDLHGQQAGEGHDQHRARGAQRDVQAPARDDIHEHDPDGAVGDVAHEERAAVPAPLEQRPRRRRAVDHDRAERQQAQRRGQDDVGLERLASSALGGGGPRHLRPQFDAGGQRSCPRSPPRPLPRGAASPLAVRAPPRVSPGRAP